MTDFEQQDILDQLAIAENFYEGEELVEKMRQIIIEAKTQWYERMSE